MNLVISVFVFCNVGIIFLCQVVSSVTVVRSNNPNSNNTGNNDTDYNCEKYDCGDGVCIEISLVCDGNEDCGDNSDEANCTDYYYNGCSQGEFDCGDGVCLNTTQMCDGVDDCGDGLDEEGCQEKQSTIINNATSLPSIVTTAMPETTTEDDYEYETCQDDQFECLDGICIDKAQVCDGEVDCFAGGDEKNCNVSSEATTTTTSSSIAETTTSDNNNLDQCQVDEFQCLNLTCVLNSTVCDGKMDCSEGEDERNCTVIQSTTLVSKMMEYTTKNAISSTNQAQTTEGCYYEDTFYPINSTITMENCNVTCANSGTNITATDEPCVACLSATANGFLLCVIASLTMIRNIV